MTRCHALSLVCICALLPQSLLLASDFEDMKIVESGKLCFVGLLSRGNIICQKLSSYIDEGAATPSPKWRIEELPEVPLKKEVKGRITRAALGKWGKDGVVLALSHRSTNDKHVQYTWAIWEDQHWKVNTLAEASDKDKSYRVMSVDNSHGGDVLQIVLERGGQSNLETVRYLNFCPAGDKGRKKDVSNSDVGRYFRGTEEVFLGALK
jgi:hypothetical protein